MKCMYLNVILPFGISHPGNAKNMRIYYKGIYNNNHRVVGRRNWRTLAQMTSCC